MMELPSTSALVCTLAILFGAWAFPKLAAWIRLCNQTRDAPGRYFLLRPFQFPSFLLPKARGINYDHDVLWREKFKYWSDLGASVVLLRGALPTAGTQGLVADASAVEAIIRSRKSSWGKPTEDYGVLKFLGPNVVTTEGEEWRRHRRLTGPSFSERNNAMVWDESNRIVSEWIAISDAKADENGELTDPDTVETTLRMALMIISAAAFGQRFDWPTPQNPAKPPAQGRKLDFITALQGSLDSLLFKLLLPDWTYSLPLKRPQQVKLFFDELRRSMLDMIEERQAEKSGGTERNDLFSALLKGVDDDEGQGVLTTEELLGNIWIFMLAGHETTAHSLAFILTLLAIYPEHQQKLFDEADAVFGDREASYDDYTSLPYSLATMQEALRLYSPVQLIPKIALEDTHLPAHTTDGSHTPISLFVPKGARMGLAASGLHFNPAYWPDPVEFRPSRFIDTADHKWNRDAWMPFSGGQRACLGQKFALVESVVIISRLLQHYSLRVPPDLETEYARRQDETELQRRDRIFRPVSRITLTPKALPIVFRRRKSEPYDPYIPGGNPSQNPTGAPQPGGSSKTAAIQAQIDDTVGIMRDNITKVAERGERLDALQDKTDNLAQSAQGFRKGATRVRKQMWWKDMKMRILIGVGIAVLVIVIVVPIVVKK